MNVDRIKDAINTDLLATADVAVVGVGASTQLCVDLARCNVGGLHLVDPDSVDATNLARQHHNHSDLGVAKTTAVARMVRDVNPSIAVHEHPLDITTIQDDLAVELFDGVDCFVAATDYFPAQARVNQLALLLNVPAVFVGLYAGGLGGEVVFWRPGLDPCFRCICSARYAAFERASAEGRSIDPSSDGADIFAIQSLDAIAGQIIVGLLTQGSANRFGRLIDQLGDRQFIQLKISPEFRVGGRDIIREKLGIPNDNEAFFAWDAIAIPDPDRGQLPCADCHNYRQHFFVREPDRWDRYTVYPPILHYAHANIWTPGMPTT